MKKILFLYDHLYLDGGTGVMVRNLASELGKFYEVTAVNTNCPLIPRGADVENCTIVDFFYRRHVSLLKQFLRKCFMLCRLTNLPFPGWLVEYTMYDEKYLRMLHAENYDFVIGVEYSCSIMAALLKKYQMTDAKIIGWQHSGFYNTFETNWVGHKTHGKLFEKVCPYFDAYTMLIPSDISKVKELFPSICAVFIPNFIEPVADQHYAGREKVILSVGRLCDVKQFDLLIRAFALLPASEWKLVIVGEGPERSRLEKLIKTLGVSARVELPGHTPHPETWYSKASFFVSSSKNEGFGLVTVEAMSYGLPVISFDFDAARYLSGNDNAMELVEQDNVEKLASAMEKMCRDEGYRREKSALSFKRGKDFSKETMCGIWTDLLEGLGRDGGQHQHTGITIPAGKGDCL